jgi:hypothetical protein
VAGPENVNAKPPQRARRYDSVAAVVLRRRLVGVPMVLVWIDEDMDTPTAMNSYKAFRTRGRRLEDFIAHLKDL